MFSFVHLYLPPDDLTKAHKSSIPKLWVISAWLVQCGSFIITVIFTLHKDLTVTDLLSFLYSQDSPKTIFVSLVMEWLFKAFWFFESFRYAVTHILHMELVIFFSLEDMNEVFQTHRRGTGGAGQLVTLAPATSSVFDEGDRERPYIMQVLHS